METPDPIVAAVEAARAELLDPGLRNPLVRVRPSRRRQVELVDERADAVLALLLDQGVAMDFLPRPEAERPLLDQLPQPPTAGPIAARHIDRHLQTRHGSVELQRRLLSTAQAARTLLEEQGINALSLAVGMLHWQHGDAELRSPLLLLPVQLERTNARCRFVARAADDEVKGNLSLAALLRADHGFELPLPDAEDFELEAWFEQVEAAVAERPEWRVERDEMLLGLFDFGRLLLYRDLDPASWPDGAGPAEHPVVRAVLGEGFAPPSASVEELPAERPPESRVDIPAEGPTTPSGTHASAVTPIEVVDADTSQSTALALAEAGHHLVIQGPPGTGKSQTITNLIAQAVARGERVLFVAEKMAALEVVHRRLTEVGLGAACLELHSHKSRKKSVLSELRRTLGLGPPQVPDDADAEQVALDAVRRRLDGAYDAVMQPVQPAGVRPLDAIGEWHQIEDPDSLPPLPFRPMAEWDRGDYLARRERVSELQARIADLGMPADHPFHGCTVYVVGPVERENLVEALGLALAAQAKARERHAELAEALGMLPPSDPHAAVTLRAVAEAFSTAPDVDGMATGDPRWHRDLSSIEAALDVLDAILDARAPAEDVLLDEAWPEELLASSSQLVEIRKDLERYGPKWWRWFSGRWRAAKATVAMLTRDDLPDDPELWIAWIGAILRVRQLERTLIPSAVLPASLFRGRWRARSTDPDQLRAAAEWLAETHRRIDDGVWPAGVRARLVRRWDNVGIAALKAAADAAEQRRRDALSEVAQLVVWTGAPLESQRYSASEELLGRWRSQMHTLPTLGAYNRLAAAARQEGLGSVVKMAASWPEAGERLLDAFDAAWYQGLIETAAAERGALAEFDRVRHMHAVERFRALDRQRFAHDRARVALAHYERLPRGNAPGLALLRREMEKKTRHLPLRRLFVDAREAVQASKPVFLMSPMSVAAYLAPRGGPRFDLVVFDEASQVRPVDALGPICRARQVVVVGDSRQMPPTRFFERLLDSGDLLDGQDNVTADLESVLGLFSAAGARGCMLRWHYRSQHPSLIAVSNHLFYGDALTLFPSPVRNPAPDDRLGLSRVYLPDAVYDRGGSRTNPAEAEAVAEAVILHAIERPDLTLGVVAFSTAQMQAISEAIERRRRSAPQGEAFFAAHVHAPFFVKNLENVQGDERDVIFISVGYGRAPDGKVYAQFGPLNLDGGERRLNVLITRARQRCVVFTHLEPEDIDLNRTEARGVHALRTFLEYARDGHLSTAPGQTPRPAPFEDAVCAALEARGHTVHRRIGDAGCAVALAVVDPDQPDRYLMGIDCEGALGTRRARDRVRLRPQVLGRLGWALHRVWAAAWHRDPVAGLTRIESALADAASGEIVPADDAELPPVVRAKGAVERPAEAVEFTDFAPYITWDGLLEGGFADMEAAVQGAVVQQIAEHEAPVAIGAIARRIVERGGARRTDQPLIRLVAKVVDGQVSQSKLRRDGWLVEVPGAGRPTPRNRRGMHRNERISSQIAPGELEAALIDTLRLAWVMPESELYDTAAQRMGLPSTEPRMRPGPWESALGRLLADGRTRRHDLEIIWEGS